MPRLEGEGADGSDGVSVRLGAYCCTLVVGLLDAPEVAAMATGFPSPPPDSSNASLPEELAAAMDRSNWDTCLEGEEGCVRGDVEVEVKSELFETLTLLAPSTRPIKPCTA